MTPNATCWPHSVSKIAGLVHTGDYRPLPHVVHPAARVEEAFRLLQHSHHTGKVVVSFDPLDEPVPVRRTPAPVALDPDGTYLITGGLGGFGAATADWLAARAPATWLWSAAAEPALPKRAPFWNRPPGPARPVQPNSSAAQAP